MRYGSWDTVWGWAFFALLPPNNLQNQNLEKLKKGSWDVIILHMCTKNHDHMMYGSWDIRHNGQFFVILAIFCTLTLLTTQKSKFWKNNENPGDSIILHLCTTNDNHMMYGSSNMEHNRHNFLSFWAIFVFLPH